MPTNDTFWPGQRVCVTGGSGFFGHFIVDWLCERGAEVFVPPLIEFAPVQSGVKDTRGVYGQ